MGSPAAVTHNSNLHLFWKYPSQVLSHSQMEFRHYLHIANWAIRYPILLTQLTRDDITSLTILATLYCNDNWEQIELASCGIAFAPWLTRMNRSNLLPGCNAGLSPLQVPLLTSSPVLGLFMPSGCWSSYSFGLTLDHTPCQIVSRKKHFEPLWIKVVA